MTKNKLPDVQKVQECDATMLIVFLKPGSKKNLFTVHFKLSFISK